MSKLKDKLLFEESPSIDDRLHANGRVSTLTNDLIDLVKRTRILRKELGSLYGKVLKDVETSLNKLVKTLDNEILSQKKKTGSMIGKK